MDGILYAYTDGGSRGNPGPGAIGIVILDKEKNVLKEHGECIGKTTNNKAEYSAVAKALEMASKIGTGRVFVFSDSLLVVSQLSGDWKIHDETLRPLHDRVKGLEKSFEKVFYRHIARSSSEFNVRADELVNKALDEA
jgi:ribonuclease HI